MLDLIERILTLPRMLRGVLWYLQSFRYSRMNKALLWFSKTFTVYHSVEWICTICTDSLRPVSRPLRYIHYINYMSWTLPKPRLQYVCYPSHEYFVGFPHYCVIKNKQRNELKQFIFAYILLHYWFLSYKQRIISSLIFRNNPFFICIKQMSEFFKI